MLSPQIKQNVIDYGTAGEQWQIMDCHRKSTGAVTMNNSTLTINSGISKI